MCVVSVCLRECVCSQSDPAVVCNPGILIAPAAQPRQPSNDAD